MKLIFSKKRLDTFKHKALHWAETHEVFCFLESNHYSNDTFNSYDFLLAVGVKSDITFPNKAVEKPFEDLANFQKDKWLFGGISYDLKNQVEQLTSTNFDGISFPDYYFFEPEILITGHKDGSVHITAPYPIAIFDTINLWAIQEAPKTEAIELKARINQKDYLSKIAQIKQHIQLGDIFEMNFCQEFYNEEAALHPISTFSALNAISKAPFASIFKLKEKYLISSSPERFLKRIGNRIISQPIKGTRKRGKTTAQDIVLSNELSNSAKDQSENVMIVDLVRNDLSKVCEGGSVKVTELFGIYSFEQVIQMISTIEGELEPDKDLADILKALFPMGSMTGAPKVRAMQLIEKLEESKRGWYSGSVGYIQPNGDFDFNVIIRSILYNALRKYVSVQVGGAIVHASEATSEFEECMLKARAMRTVLSKEN